jgi:hypothetical protein
MKVKARGWEKIFSKQISEEGFIFAHIKNLFKSILRKTTQLLKLCEISEQRFLFFFYFPPQTVAYIFFFCLFVCLFGGNGIWNQHLVLARQVLYHLSHSTSLSNNFSKEDIWVAIRPKKRCIQYH